MPIVKYASVLDEVMRMPVFTAKDLVIRGVPRSYVRRLANLLKEKGRIKIVERGKYAVTEDPLLVAPFLTFPSYVSMFSALLIRGAISQMPMGVQVVTTRKRKNKVATYNDTKIEFFRIKRRLFFGFEYVWYEGFQVPVAKPEKALIDIYYFGYSVRGLEIDCSKFNSRTLKEYLEVVGKKSVSRRVLEVMEC
ncbi:MAG: type IV toxin-antitoxin system AbiEi family antitoxin domain-containing protein [Candidatus Freyarchaeota archaeon]|nr:hypothetical protein [Candidatus Freyrarchaeum guaymaensis]